MNMRNGKRDMGNILSEGCDKQGATDMPRSCVTISSLMKHDLSLDF